MEGRVKIQYEELLVFYQLHPELGLQKKDKHSNKQEAVPIL